jgi:hypothetical protein
MEPIRVDVRFEAPPELVWVVLADLASHPQWMRDAGSIEFLTGRTSGVGTLMLVPTRVGPFRTTDVMEVVGWEEGRLIVVEHRGAVAGVGRFELVSSATGSELHWSETLVFPWWLAGPVGAWLARPVLKRIWRENLERLRDRVEVSGP